nr:unnamed protein product [Callosobruchus analis]
MVRIYKRKLGSRRYADYSIEKKCNDEDIHFICLPPNSTHLTQPLDVAFFRPMKVAWRKVLIDWKATPEGMSCTILPKHQFPPLLKRVLENLEPNFKKNLESGFRKCGIYPCDVQPLLDRIAHKQVEPSAICSAFLNVLLSTREACTGKSLSHDELLLNGSIEEQPMKQQQQPINNNPQLGTSGIRTKKLKYLGETKKQKSHHDSEDEESEDDSEPIFNDSSDDDNDWDTYRAKEIEKINAGADQEEEIPFLARIKPLMKQIDTFVVVQYEGNHYPGIIEHVEEDGAYANFPNPETLPQSSIMTFFIAQKASVITTKRRSRRIVALAQTSDSAGAAYQSDTSSSAPSLDSFLQNNIEVDSDNSFIDPDFEVSPEPSTKVESSYSTDNSDSPMKIRKVFGKENSTANKITILSDIKLQASLPSKKVVPDSIKKKKRTYCKFCQDSVTNFERHLERNHTDCKEVIDLLSFPKKHPERKNILSLIRNSGNFNEFLRGNIHPRYGLSSNDTQYYPCHRCKALLKKQYLSRHRSKCVLCHLVPKKNPRNKISEATASQTLIACSLDENNTIHRLRIKEEVFPRMKADDISFTAKTDFLICRFGENYLKKHKREQLNIICSNKMRELARFLIEFRKISNTPNAALKDVLTPNYLIWSLSLARIAASLSAHLGTSLKQVCDLFISMLLKEDPCLPVSGKEELIKDTKRFRQLIETQWTTEISSLAFKSLQEQRWQKPVILPLTSDVKKFKEYVTKVADKGHLRQEFKNLVEASLALTILFNRRRIGDVQYTHLKTYTDRKATMNQKECENALSETEKILAKYYERFVTGGKGSRQVAILLPVQLQEYIQLFTDIRANNDLVPNENPYLFACPGTTKWTRGDVIISKFAKKADLQYPNQISSNRLRKQIATVMQILNLSSEEMAQFAQFMGHTEKTHDDFYKLPQDVYQTAKVSKLLLLMETGAEKYKGKALKDIDIDPTNEIAIEDIDETEDDFIRATEVSQVIPRTTVEANSTTSTEPPTITGRTGWTEEQKCLLKKYFAEHIRLKKAPKNTSA